MQNTFKVGDKVKVVKFTHSFPSRYKEFIDQEFYVIQAAREGVSIEDPDKVTSFIFLYNEEIELVKEAPKKKKPKPEGNFAWGVFLANGKLDKVFKTREEARIYKSKGFPMTIKKIKYEIV